MHVTGTNPNPANFAGSETGVNVTLGTGGFTVTETKPTGTFTAPFFTGDCNANGAGTIVGGQHLTCTVKNVGPPCVGCFQKLLTSIQIRNLLATTSLITGLQINTLEELCNLLATGGIDIAIFRGILNGFLPNDPGRVTLILDCLGQRGDA
jgi:hypothetical protein